MTGSCDPGVITPSVNNINLAGATILAGSSCTFSIDVLAVAVGTQCQHHGCRDFQRRWHGWYGECDVEVVTPDLTITKSHTGNFVRPQTGATYTITVNNAGTVDTTALITMK